LITVFIIVASILLAAAFAWAWFFRPVFRQQIEHPKHSFQEQVRAYDQHCELTRESLEGGADEPG
jgi:hypothetical protein